LHRRLEAGLGAVAQPGREHRRERALARAAGLDQQRRDLAQQRDVDERRAHLDRMGHARPVGVAQQLVAHVERGLQRRDAAVRRVGIGRDRGLEDLEDLQALERVLGLVGSENRVQLARQVEPALQQIRAGVCRAVFAEEPLLRMLREHRRGVGDRRMREPDDPRHVRE
jgi:hypothetical protein